MKLAANDARRLLVEAAAKLWQLSPDAIRLDQNNVSAKGRRALKLNELLQQASIAEIVAVGSSESKGLWAGDSGKAAKDSSAPGWPFGAQAVEVTVDRETGMVKLLRVASAHDVGQALNPMAVTGQIQGGIMMGLGYALSEGLIFDHGKVANGSFADYKIPTVCDIPEATPIIVEKQYDSEPYGAKGVGEMSVFGIAPAVANAVARATGVRLKELPMSAEKLLAKMHRS